MKTENNKSFSFLIGKIIGEAIILTIGVGLLIFLILLFGKLFYFILF